MPLVFSPTLHLFNKRNKKVVSFFMRNEKQQFDAFEQNTESSRSHERIRTQYDKPQYLFYNGSRKTKVIIHNGSVLSAKVNFSFEAMVEKVYCHKLYNKTPAASGVRFHVRDTFISTESILSASLFF